MDKAPAAVRAAGLDLFRRVYRKCHEIARAEITNTFGQAWRGGRLDAAYLTGHIPVPGVVLSPAIQKGYSSVSAGANADTATATITFPTAYPSSPTDTPTVVVTSGDTAWVAMETNVTPADFSILVARRLPLSTPESGAFSATILAGTSFIDTTVTFPTAFQSAPQVVATPQQAGLAVAVITVSATQVVIRLSNAQPVGASGTTGSIHGGAPNSGVPSPNTSDGMNGAISTGGPSDNESDLTTVNTDSTGGPSTNASGSAGSHAHTENTDPTYTQNATTSAVGGHTHTLSSHTHGVGDHSHAMKHHTHGVGTHTHDMASHLHVVTDHTHDLTLTYNVAVNTAGTVQWSATGLQTSASHAVAFAWLAVG